MRTIVAAWLVLAAGGTAWAQGNARKPHPSPAPVTGRAARQGASSVPGPSVNPAPPKPAPAPQPPATRPSPPDVGPPALSSPFDAGPFTYAPRYDRPSRPPRPPFNWGSGFFGSSGYGAPFEILPSTPQTESRTAPDEQLSQSGVLELEIEPRTADVYVDGFFVGTADDVVQNGLVLRAGHHWVDVRSPGYDTLTLQVNIVIGQYVRYRRDLRLASGPASSAPSARPATGPQTIYVIPGCYGGNRPPNESALPLGCNIANLKIVTTP